MSANEGDLMGSIMELMPTMLKYSEIEPEFIKIDIEEFNNGAQIKIISDKPEVSKALTEILLMMGKLSETNPKTKVEVTTK
jgi:hypothetical protein